MARVKPYLNVAKMQLVHNEKILHHMQTGHVYFKKKEWACRHAGMQASVQEIQHAWMITLP